MNKTTVIEDMGQSERKRAARNALELTEAEIVAIEQTETETGTGETGA